MKSLVRRLHPALFISFFCACLHAQEISIQALVTPSTLITKDGRPVNFALHGLIVFGSLSELFPYIDSQAHRWPGNPAFDDAKRQQLARELLRRGIESRIVSMIDERPFETLVTHTEGELRSALAQVTEPTPAGYADAFVAVQQKWKHAINCWSAAPSIPARVLSNWYPIAEGIPLYGATYDSTEHFWQAVKYHSDTTVSDLDALLTTFEHQSWTPWLARLDNNPSLYLPNAYAIEFLRSNLKRDRFRWFRDQLTTHNLQPTAHARAAQQRTTAPAHFTPFEEKVIWGDLADVFHLVYTFSLPEDPLRATLAHSHFDAIYLCNRKMPFISEDFRSLMLEIWQVKYLRMPRFREVISSIPIEIRLEHFLNDGDSPDIPIPIYVGYLNQIRDLARQH
ncbi:MAG: hypothetical protein JO249_14680 [Acidobacteria bacterium]|nr:hypothetical protein [Acidobacteriota bacterium]